MLLLTLLLLILPVMVAATLLVHYRLAAEKTEALLIGSLLGYSLTTFLVYLLDLAFLSPTIALLAVLLIQFLIIAFFFSRTLTDWQSLPFKRDTLIILLTVLLLLGPSASKLLFWENGNLKTGIINAWGDLGWHVANISMFAQGQSIPPENPIYAGQKLVYPFLANYFSGLLVAAGTDISNSVTIPALIFTTLSVSLLFLLTKKLTKNRWAAVLATALLIFGGASLGWIRIIEDINLSNTSFINFIFHLPNRDYSGVGSDSAGFHFLNPVSTLMLPQRPFLFGLPIALSIIYFLLPSPDQTVKKRFLLAGILAGILPLFHAHTVLALIPPIMALFLLNRQQPWHFFVLPALIIGSPAVAYYLSNPSQDDSFFRWGPRWMAGDENLIRYWLKNTGLIIPLAIVGIFTKSAPQIIRYLAAAGLFVFIIANLFLFAPWAWDNYKLFVYWYIFSLPLISLLIVKTFKKYHSLPVRALIIALFIAHTLSGALDLWKISLPTAAAWVEWGRTDIFAAETIKRYTNPGDTIVTAPIHNSPVALAGRPLYLGYLGHIWSHGYNGAPRQQSLQTLYTQGTLAMAEHQPDYILVGPVEKMQFPNLVIQPEWKLVAQSGPYSLFEFPAR